MTVTNHEYCEIFAKLKTLLERYSEPGVSIGEETELVDDLGLDSLKAMEMLFEVEDLFDISYSINNLSEVRTVKELVLQIQQTIKKNDGNF
jgi:acyl carrier protein